MEPHKKEKRDHSSYLDHVVGTGEAVTVSRIDSLAGALRVGFLVLKILMGVLTVVFLFSNIYWVPEGTVAVQLRFGKILGEKTAAARPPGGPYLAFPYPVDKILRIPTTIQKVTIFKAFWSEEESLEPVIDDRPETEGLRPGVHGSLVTADKNIVQGVWVVHYKLDFPARDSRNGAAIHDFICNVGTMERAVEIIRRIAQSAIVRVVSQTPVGDFIAGQIDHNEIKRLIAARLTLLKAGLQVTSVSTNRYAAPKSLVPDFQAVTQAESEKALAIEKASRHRVSTLNEMAGSGWQELLDAVEAYAQALCKGDRAEEEAAFLAARNILLGEAMGGFITGILDEARSEKTSTIQRARATAARFIELLPSYAENPQVVKSQLLQDALEEIWSDPSVSAFYLPRGQKIFIDVGNLSLEENGFVPNRK